MAAVVDRVSVDVVQANLLWGFLGGLIGLFIGLLGIVGVIIGVIALGLAWMWMKTSARMKMLLFGMGIVSVFLGFITMLAVASFSSLGLTAEETAGIGWFGAIMSVPKTLDETIGVSRALLNVETGVPTTAGLSALSRLTGTATTTTTTGGGAVA